MLIVSLEEFAELVGVTGETMRAHLKEIGRDGATVPDWLVERGDRGRAYKIEAEGAVAWWQAKREADEIADKDRVAQLAQMRLDLLGEAGGAVEQLELSGRRRKEEFQAAFEALRYRKALGELVEKGAVERVVSAASVELRRRLQQLPAEFAIAAGIDDDQRRKLSDMIERELGTFVDEITAPGAFLE